MAGAPLQCLHQTTPQHTVGADHLAEDVVPAPAIQCVACTCTADPCPKSRVSALQGESTSKKEARAQARQDPGREESQGGKPGWCLGRHHAKRPRQRSRPASTTASTTASSPHRQCPCSVQCPARPPIGIQFQRCCRVQWRHPIGIQFQRCCSAQCPVRHPMAMHSLPSNAMVVQVPQGRRERTGAHPAEVRVDVQACWGVGGSAAAAGGGGAEGGAARTC